MKKSLNKKLFLVTLVIFAGFGFYTKAEAATPAFVQKNENLVFSAGSVSTTLSGIVAQNAVAVGIYWNGAGITLTSVTDNCSEPQAYTLLDNPMTTGTVHGATAYNYNVTGGNCTITATFSGTAGEAKIWVHEVSGVAKTDPIDGHNAKVDSFRNTTCTDCIDSNSIITTANNDYIFGVTLGGASPTLNAGTNFTKRSTGDSRGMTEDLVQSSAGSISATFSRTNTTGGTNISFVMALKADVAPDVTPPVLSGGSPSGLLNRTTTNATLQIATNEDATCKFSTTPGIAYASMTGTFVTADNRAHSTSTPVTAGNTYTYYVRCQDTAGNPNTSDTTITFKVSNGTAATCSQADVQAEVDIANAGNTISVPAGDCSWTSPVTISNTQDLSIIGAGVGNTTITDNGTDTTFNIGRLFQINSGSNKSIRISAMTLKTGSTPPSSTSGLIYVYGSGTTTRIDHLDFPAMTYTGISLHQDNGFTAGVVDSSTFTPITVGWTGNAIKLYGATAGNDTAWTGRAFTPGTANAWYIEGNTFTFFLRGNDTWDAYGGARVVMRYNTVHGAMAGGHGNDSGNYASTHTTEIYNNSFDNTCGGSECNNGTNLSSAVTWRGGTGVMFNNTFDSNINTPSIVVNYRSNPYYEGTATNGDLSTTVLQDSSASFGSGQAITAGQYIYNQTDGSHCTVASNTSTSITCSSGLTGGTTNRWNNGDHYSETYFFNDDLMCDGYGPNDGNVSGQQGWLCKQQVGSTYDSGYVYKPIYAWNNNWNGIIAGWLANNTGNSTRSNTYHVLENRTYFNCANAADCKTKTDAINIPGFGTNQGWAYSSYTCPNPITALSGTCDSLIAGASGYNVSALTYSVGGAISGLSGSVVLQNNGGDNLTVSANGSFTFATSIADSASYAITVLTQPSGQTCSVSSGSGTVSSANVTSVSIVCTTNSTPTPAVVAANGPIYGSYQRNISNLLAPTTTPVITSSTTTVTTPKYNFTRNLQLHMTGKDVKALQQYLNAHGFVISKTGAGSPGNETDYFGTLTLQALQKMQCAELNICSGDPDTTGYGNFGPLTRNKINSLSSTTTDTTTPVQTSTSVTNTSYDFTRDLYYRMVGNDVLYLQQYLNTHGFVVSTTDAGSPGNETTLFGSLTYKALQKFQKSVGLPATGYFGPMTREYLRTH